MAEQIGQTKPESKAHEAHFPSVGMLVFMYSTAALIALLLTFIRPLDQMQITFCLVISWLLTSGALGMSLFLEHEGFEDPEELD